MLRLTASLCAAATAIAAAAGCCGAATARAAARSCAGARYIDQPATARYHGAHGSRISGEWSVSAQIGQQMVPLGFEYQTYGGQEYFQFGTGISLVSGTLRAAGRPGPVVPYHGNVVEAISALAKGFNVSQQQLPFPYRAVDARTKIGKARC